MPDGTLLRVEHLTMRFGGLVAVDDLSFEARQGQITALIGPNGAGKTTVFNCITGFYRPSEGRLGLRHGAPSAWDMLESLTNSGARHRAAGDGTLFLLERMPDFLVAQHNLLMRASGYTLFGVLGLPSYGAAERAAIEKARAWLERVGLTARADDPAGDLPYGAQRRLEIARAMCTDPVLLCLDEPAAGLNPRESAELNQLLLSIRDDDKISVLDRKSVV